LEEPTPEQKRRHRLKVIDLLKNIWTVHPEMKLLYKPFPGSYRNDPIKIDLAEEIRSGKVNVINGRPVDLYGRVDVVLWDSISTGFAESIQTGVPTLVFHSREEYEQAHPVGKKIDEGISRGGVLFYDVETGLKSFNMAIADYERFIADNSEALRNFMAGIAWPVKRDEFLRRAEQALGTAIR